MILRCLLRRWEEGPGWPCELGAAAVRGGIVACSIEHRLLRTDRYLLLVWKEGEAEGLWALLVVVADIAVAVAVVVVAADQPSHFHPDSKKSAKSKSSTLSVAVVVAAAVAHSHDADYNSDLGSATQAASLACSPQDTEDTAASATNSRTPPNYAS